MAYSFTPKNIIYKIQDLSLDSNKIFELHLLKDSHWKNKSFKEAGLAALHLYLLQSISKKELVCFWVSCLKSNKTLKNHSNIVNITMKQLYDDFVAKENYTNSRTLSSEELICMVIDEYKGLKKEFMFDSMQEEFACINTLKSFNTVEGYLFETLTFYEYRDINKQSHCPLISATNAVKFLEASTKKIKAEWNARAYFMLYICQYHKIQAKAKIDMNKESKNNNELEQTLGEESQQQDDLSNCFLTTSISTFEKQQQRLEVLNRSLDQWQIAVQLETIKDVDIACQSLLSIAFIFNLNGILTSTLKAYNLLISLSSMHDMNNFKQIGIVELLKLIPEALNESVVENLIKDLENEPSKLNKGESINYSKFEGLAAVAYYYYKCANYEKGVEFIRQCLNEDLLKKETSAYEANVEIFYVSALYAALPSETLKNDIMLPNTALMYAIQAMRCAFSLNVEAASTPKYNYIIGWEHKKVWLYHKAAINYGSFDEIIGNLPDTKIHIKQNIEHMKIFGIPLRIAECLTMLAEMDIRHGMLDDCRREMNNLDYLFESHSPLDCPEGGFEKCQLCSSTDIHCLASRFSIFNAWINYKKPEVLRRCLEQSSNNLQHIEETIPQISSMMIRKSLKLLLDIQFLAEDAEEAMNQHFISKVLPTKLWNWFMTTEVFFGINNLEALAICNVAEEEVSKMTNFEQVLVENQNILLRLHTQALYIGSNLQSEDEE